MPFQRPIRASVSAIFKVKWRTKTADEGVVGGRWFLDTPAVGVPQVGPVDLTPRLYRTAKKTRQYKISICRRPSGLALFLYWVAL
ncbi:MAG: hypothetical protein CMH52_08640 [Myxococcales bacterium]|nr:hypothetical protein [Myxococcales bacterium]